MGINLTNVSFRYASTAGGSVPAVEGLSLSFQDAAISSIVGPSGCGKSTILSLIIGLLVPTSGSIVVEPPTSAKAPILFGISFQNPALLSWETVRSNIELPATLHPGMKVAATKTNEILELMGLTNFQERYPHELSGGMQIRASLGRALLLDPPFVLLDEPFGSLDEKTSMDLMKLIRSINQRLGITFIVVTHNVLQAVYMSNFIFTLSSRPGRLLNEYAIDANSPRRLSEGTTLSFAQRIRSDLGISDG